MSEETKQLGKVQLLMMSTGSTYDKIISIHSTKRSAIKAKRDKEKELVGAVPARDVTDYYIVEKYVLDEE